MVNVKSALAALAVCHVTFSASDKTRTPRQRAETLLAQMTWEEKIGQLGGIRRLLKQGPEVDEENLNEIHALQNGNIGRPSSPCFGATFNWANDILPPTNAVRQKQINDSRLHIPYITVTDSVNSLYLSGGTVFPSNLAAAASFNLPLFQRAVAAIREEQLAIGVTWVLSPVLDIARDPRFGRVGETFGEDAYLVGEFGHTYVNTMQDEDADGNIKVACTIKHFVYGEVAGGVNAASQYGGLNHIFNDHLRPYMRALEAAPAAVMVSYASVDLVPMSANEYLLQDILRGTLGFGGVVMSDAFSVPHLYTESRVAESYEEAALLALRAGVQMELSPGQPAAFPTLIDSTNDSSVVRLVDDAVANILQIKYATGLFDKPLPEPSQVNKTVRIPAHLELARDLARESIVLLKNDGVLPQMPDKIALLGPFGDILNTGSYAPVNASNSRWGRSLYRSLKVALGADKVQLVRGVDYIDTTNATGIADAVVAAKEAGFAVLALGALSVSMDDPLFAKRTDGEFFSHADLGLPGLQQELLNAVLDSGVPTVLILSGGQPFVLDNSTLRANAIMHSLLGGEFTGDALVDILTGRANPSGKLPISIPEHSAAVPIFYDYLPSDDTGGSTARLGYHSAWQFPRLQRQPPMPFGFGLSYTTFDMSGPSATYRNGAVTLSVSVKNTGHVAGKEVVQVYQRPATSTGIEVPVRRLVRVEKVDLKPGETKEVEFHIPRKELGYYVNTKLTVKTGLYNFWAGSSSRSEDLKGVNVTVT